MPVGSEEPTEGTNFDFLVAIGELIFITAVPRLEAGSPFDFTSFGARSWLSLRQRHGGDTTMIHDWSRALSNIWYRCEHLERKRLALSFAFFVRY